MTRLFLLVFALLAAGCGKETILLPQAPSVDVAAGEAFALKLGHVAELRGEGLTVTFAAVPEDSRCPVGVACVWAGNAKVKLQVHRHRMATEEMILNTSLEPRQGSYHGTEIRLVSLSPSPREGSSIDPAQYVATLQIAPR